MKMKEKGFTFVEIMVTAAIIAVLAAVGMVSYENANKKVRDGRRKADLEQIRVALEMYKSDNTYYPDDFSGLATYINPVPTPPSRSKKCDGSDPDPFLYIHGYTPSLAGSATSYTICTRLEIPVGVDYTYTVYSP